MSWGMTGIAGRLRPSAAPAAFLFLRFLTALVIQAACFWGSLRAITGRVLGAGVLLSLPFYAGFLLQATGLASTSSSVSAFLTSLFVVLTPVLGRLFFRERVAASTILGALVSLGGVYVLTDPAGGLGRGEILTLACAVAFALQIQMTNVITRNCSPEAITFIQFSCAVLFSGVILLALGVQPAELVRSLGGKHVTWTVLYTGSACSVVAMGVLNRFQRDISPTRASVLYMLEPVFASLFAVSIAGESMSGRKFLGGAIILAGNLLCEWFGRRTLEETIA